MELAVLGVRGYLLRTINSQEEYWSLPALFFWFLNWYLLSVPDNTFLPEGYLHVAWTGINWPNFCHRFTAQFLPDQNVWTEALSRRKSLAVAWLRSQEVFQNLVSLYGSPHISTSSCLARITSYPAVLSRMSPMSAEGLDMFVVLENRWLYLYLCPPLYMKLLDLLKKSFSHSLSSSLPYLAFLISIESHWKPDIPTITEASFVVAGFMKALFLIL